VITFYVPTIEIANEFATNKTPKTIVKLYINASNPLLVLKDSVTLPPNTVPKLEFPFCNNTEITTKTEITIWLIINGFILFELIF